MTRSANSTVPQLPDHARVGSRYQIEELLGRGGMACVYRALDVASGQRVALKQLRSSSAAPEQAHAALFEREFQTLMQLRHPHVISVYDYGLLDDGSPYYTMELLDGGDLRERAPLPWREACKVTFEVCSSLALLHSRRLLHRDVSPRNIRCTLDGSAKLIDFGALAPMSAGGAQVVGTPAFTAPETLHGLALDARTDLFSLGVTLYYALTARVPYPARTFADLLAAWGQKVTPPSAFVSEIPAALDALVLALMNVEPALRPNTAFDVMQRLAACAGLQAIESEAVSRAYLSTPSLVGRDEVLSGLREQLKSARMSRGASVLLTGASGVGRSRLLDACVLEAKTLGFTVLRATASGTREAFAIARALTAQLLDALPSDGAVQLASELFAPPPATPGGDVEQTASLRPVLRDFSDPKLDGAELQTALCRSLKNVSRGHPLLIAVDDVHRIDRPSAALLAELIELTERGAIFVALTADAEAAADETLEVLARRCSKLPVAALNREQTQRLLGSLFGDVANLEMLSGEIHRIAAGNPRQSIELAQFLVDRSLIRYAAGTWTLPSSLSSSDLPSNAGAAMRARIELWSEDARFLAESQALAFYEAFEDADYRGVLPELPSGEVERALSELIATGAVVRDGALHLLANRVWSAALTDALTPDALQRRHSALAALYEAKGQIIPTIHHLFASGQNERGLEAIGRQAAQYAANRNHRDMLARNIGKMIWCYVPALETAERLRCSRHQISELRRAHYSGSVAVENSAYTESARLWAEQLVHDSGLDLYRRDTQTSDPAERLTRSLTAAQQRYLATPEHERVYSPEEAIRRLAEYVVVSIAIGGRSQDAKLVRSLPSLLEPFAGLSPLLQAIWHNALATYHTNCARWELAREHWEKAFEILEPISNSEARFIEPMRNAIAYAIGMSEAQLGRSSAVQWASRLDDDPYQRISALNLRKIVRLEQGDALGAERLRRQAEIMSLQRPAPQMFKSLLSVELAAHEKGRDLAGIQQVIEHMRPLAACYPSWRANLIYAQGAFHHVRGDHAAARAMFEQAIELSAFDADGDSRNQAVWVSAQGSLAEVLFESGEIEQARSVASAALACCEGRRIVAHAFDLVRIQALAEAKLGDAGATQRLDALIELQTQLGSTGLRLGLSYEARARIASWSGDAAGFERYAELTAREYRHGANTPLGARYAQLMHEAAGRGLHATASLADFKSLTSMDSASFTSNELFTVVTRSLSDSRNPTQRLDLALQLICAAHGASIGHLYLIAPGGAALAASQGATAPAPELGDFVTEYIVTAQQHAEDIDDMATGELAQDAVLATTMQSMDSSYELLPLGCLFETRNLLVGIAAISVAGPQPRNVMQAQLLQAVAAHLLAAGDARGVQLTT